MAGTAALLGLGLSLGLSGGLAPGPLTALVVRETLQHGTRAGLTVAVAPLLTDGPILLLTGLVLRRLSDLGPVLGVTSVVGAVVLGWLGWQTARAPAPDLHAPGSPASGGSLRRALAVNLVNPHPWVFWVTVGTPSTLQALDAGVGVAAGFLALFFAGLCGVKIALALGLGRISRFFAGPAYRLVMQGLGLALAGFGGLLLWDGLQRLGFAG